MKLIKTSLYTAASTGITFVTGLIVIKVVAQQIGPSGIAYVGQFQNTAAIFTLLATGAISNGVVKYLAGSQSDKERQQQVLGSALAILLACSLVISVFVLAFSRHLSISAFNDSGFQLVYVLYGVSITVISLNLFCNAVYNGLKQIRTLTLINIISSLVGVSFTVSLAYYYGVIGVLIAGNFMSLSVFLVNLYIFRKKKIARFRLGFKHADKKIVCQLLGFSMMGVVSGFLTPAIQLLLRNKIMRSFSVPEAGYWQGVTRISDYYLIFITTVLSVYYLPRLSEISNKTELRNEIGQGYKLVLPAIAVLTITIWLLKEVIVQVLFTPSFMPMVPLFKFQLLGDFFKIGSWLLGFLMISKAMVKNYIITEVLFSISYVIFGFLLMNQFGIIGATYAFALNYLLYWITLWFLLRRHIV